VGREFILGEEEKAFFHSILRSFEGFSGVEVLGYCLMDNHFHILLHIPARPSEIPEEEVFRRMKFIYTAEKIDDFRHMIAVEEEKGNPGFREQFLESQRRRMYDLSEFIKELKQRFSRWYNKRHDRKGTLWEDRFKSVLVEGNENALLHVAAYIALNPVRAGIVKHPREHRWNSYAEAAAGGKKARNGIQKIISGRGNLLDWKTAERAFSSYFEHRSHQQSHRRKAVESGGENVMAAEQKAQEPAHPLLGRVRYFCEGLILGSREFVENFFQEVSDPFRRPRRRAHRILKDGPGDLYSYRRFHS
jgi:REP element-mobilizing transposase RayT